MKNLLPLLSCMATLSAFGAGDPYIAPYLNDKQAAFSFTFDDGFKSEVDDTLEIIDPLGIKGTFFLIPSRVTTGKADSIKWDQAKAMQATGHEIGTHDAVKPRLHEIPIKEVREKINGGAGLIEQNTGVKSVSFAMPGGSKGTPEVLEVIYEQHYFLRSPDKLPNAQQASYGNTDRKKWDDQQTRKQIEKAIDAGKWFIPVVHSIVKGYSPFKSKEEFQEHCEWLVSKEDVLWIAPLGTVGRYVYERDATKLDVTDESANSMTFTLTCSLDNKAVFNAPLTVVIPDTGASSASAKDASGKLIETNVEDGKILINVAPGGPPVTVSW